MIATIIIMSLIIVGVITYIVLDRLGLLENLFNNNITQRVEKKNRIDGEIEVLKKKQKVKSEEILHDYEDKKQSTVDQINATINSLQAQITSLKASKATKCQMLDEQRKVELDKVINEFDNKIINKQNKSKKLARYIEAERNNINDTIAPQQPNAPMQLISDIGFKAPAKKSKKTTKK